MRARYSIKALIALTTLLAVSFTLTLPTVRSRSFIASFQNQVENRNLEWLESTLRTDVHQQTERLGLISTGCAHYQPVLEPLSFGDVLLCRRRIRLQHCGAWDLVGPHLAERQLLALFETDTQTQPWPKGDVIIHQTLQGLILVKDPNEGE